MGTLTGNGPINGEVVFSKKANNTDHPDLFFNNVQIDRCLNEKHLGLILDEKLSFKNHVDKKINKATKIIGTIRKLNSVLPRLSLLTIYKSFVRPHLDYGDVIYDQPNNKSFIDKIESVQYDAALAITGAIRGTSRIKLYKELGLESLKDRRWMHRLFFFRKIFLPALLRIFLIPSHLKPFYKDIQTVLLVIVAEQFFFKIHFFLTW